MRKRSEKKWSGRFAGAPDPVAAGYSESVSFDKRLAFSDIECSRAHARMLAARKVIKGADCGRILKGLDTIEKEIRAGRFDWRTGDEDVHRNIERRLIELAGEAGKRLHTARSRNDQVATDIRHWLRAEIDGTLALLSGLRSALLDLAEKHVSTLMPGLTHLQVAQPITFAHHLLAYDRMLERDQSRLRDCRSRMNRSPLGACALAGTGFDIDPRMTARELGFDGPCENSVDAVSDRDHLIEFCAAAAIAMMHLSRLGEELVLWSSPALGFVRIGDAFSTGSSIMPQKRNPDIPELARGKSGRVFGDLVALLALMKSQPLAYNRDNQEDKERVFDSADTLRESLRVFAAMVPAIEVDAGRMRAAAGQGHAAATELADNLVRKGFPFRDAHEAASRAVRHAEEKGCELSALSPEELASVSGLPAGEAKGVFDLDRAVASRRHIGGTSPANCRAAIRKARAQIAKAG